MANGMVSTGRAYNQSALDSMRRFSSQYEKDKADNEMMKQQMDVAEDQQNLQIASTAVSTIATIVSAFI